MDPGRRLESAPARGRQWTSKVDPNCSTPEEQSWQAVQREMAQPPEPSHQEN